MYKTNNFNNASKWLKRIFFLTLFVVLLFVTTFDINYLSTKDFLIIFSGYILLIIAGQFDELEINEDCIIISQSSIVPFLRSKRTIQYTSIINIKKNSNFINNDGHWFVFLHKNDDNLEIQLEDGKAEIINGKLHPRGSKGIAELINEYRIV